MANTSILQVFIVFIMAQVCLLMMMATPIAQAAGRLMGYNPVCCPRDIYCCGFGSVMANGTASSTKP
uniref:Hydrophobic seed protein domain-containing protein n=2 Tax=Aegilops tauschii TaxID=37682 RepID=A0A453A1K2_AEGTS